MRKLLLLLGALGLAGPVAQTAAAPTAAAAPVPLSAAQRTAALDLLTAMQTEQQLNSQIGIMLASQEAAQAQMMAKSPGMHGQTRAMQAEMRQFYQNAMGWEAVREDMVQAYGSHFSADELHSLTAFYRSKTGQMLLRKQPEATRQVMVATQRRMTALLPELQRIMQRSLPQPAPANPAPKPPGN